MSKAILYVRVSTDEQADKGYSQRNQEEVLVRYCQYNLIEVEKVVFEDHSAKTFNRPEWKKLILGLKKQKHRPGFVLFTKWDRFSRNAADAYQMIRLLTDYGVEPQAIEQPLDLSIPENKMMLAFYLAAPEVENDRRALNVFHGMRRAKKEGRWMGTAPYGYENKSTEGGQKYICPVESEAGLMKWAFHEIAEGRYNTEQIWKEAKRKGLACGRNNFWNLIKNPIYCGKIIVPAYKDEPVQWVSGQHQPIISEAVFSQAQEVLNGRSRKKIERKIMVPPQMVLRGFLNCPKCGRVLTGSASTGRYARYYYYHCQNRCNYRVRADLTNEIFLKILTKNMFDKRFIPLFEIILKEANRKETSSMLKSQQNILKQIEFQQTRFTRARDLYINGELSIVDYQDVKTGCEVKLKNLKDDLKNLFPNCTGFSIFNYDNLLPDLFKSASIEHKRKLIGLMFPSNLVFDNYKFVVKQYGLAFKAIFQNVEF